MTEKATTPEQTKLEKNAQEIMAERKAAQGKTAKKETAKTKPSKKPAGANWALRILLVLIVLLLGAVASVYFMPTLKDRIPVVAEWIGTEKSDTSGFNQKIDGLESRLARQDIDIQALKDTIRNLPTQDQEPDPLLLERLESLEQAKFQADKVEQDMSQSARIDMLLSRMSQLEASFVPLSKGLLQAQDARQERSQLAETTAAQSEQLNRMEDRLSRVEDYAGRDNSGALLAFRIGELRRKVTSGTAFGPEIKALKAMMAQGTFALDSQISDAITWLSQHEDGIATGDKLRDQFDDLIPNLIRAGASQPDDPWWKRAYDSTKSLIMVRKTENNAENISETLDNTIASAHQMLMRFDLKEALSLLKQLPDSIQETLEVWMMQAEIYLRAGDELDRIESLIAAYYLDSKDPAKPEEAEETSS